MSERVSMYDLVGMIHAELSRGIERKMMPDLAAAREVDELLVDLNARLNAADAKVEELLRENARSYRFRNALEDADRARGVAPGQFETTSEKLLRANQEHYDKVVALEEQRMAMNLDQWREQIAVVNRNTDALEKIAAAVSREREKQDATGEVLRKVGNIQKEIVSRLDAVRRFAAWWAGQATALEVWKPDLDEVARTAFVAGFVEAQRDLVHVPLEKEATPSAPSAPPKGNHEAFRTLWSRAVGTEGYDKELWLQLDRALFPGGAL